jgi:hypothetical protein
MTESSSPAGKIKSLLQIIKSENFKFWAIRSNLGLSLIAALVPFIVAVMKSLMVFNSEPNLFSGEEGISATIGTFGLPLMFVSGLYGVRLATDDYVQSVINLARLAIISTWKIVLSKWLVLVLWSCVFFSIGIALATASTTAILRRGSALSAFYGLLPQIGLELVGCLLVASIGFCIGSISKSGLGAGLHFAFLFALAPVVVAIAAGKNDRIFTSLLPTSGFQAIFTRGGAAPVTIEGVPPSVLSQGQGLALVGLWAIWFFMLAFVFGYKPGNHNQTFTRWEVHREKTRKRQGKLRSDLAATWVSELYKASTLRATWLFVFFLVTVYIAVGRIASLQNPLANVLADPLEGRASLELDAFTYQTLSLSASAGFLQVLLVLFGCFISLIDTTGGGMSLTFRSTPNRFKVWSVKVCTFGSSIFLLIALTGFVTAAALAPLESSYGFPIGAFSEPAMTCILTFSFGGACCFLIGFSLATFLNSAIASVFASLGLIVIAPSVLGALGSVTSGTQNVWTYNLHSFFPYLPGAVRWKAPNEVIPHIVGGGMSQMEPQQQLQVIVAWTLFLLVASAISFSFKTQRT